MNAFSKVKNKRLVIGGSILVLLALGCLAFLKFESVGKLQTQTTPSVKTTEVTVGDLTVDVSGTGSIVAPNAVDLAFSTTGKVAEVNVNQGSLVDKGDVLARLDRITSLQIDVQNARLNLDKAEKALEDLETNKEITLGKALIAKSDAAAALEKAQKGEVNKYTGRCEKSVTESYYFEYMYQRGYYLYWARFLEGGSGYGEMYIRENMAPYEKTMRTNYANWKYCEGYSELEIEQSQAAVEKAQADYDKASKYYDTLKENDGIDPDELANAQQTKKNAELQLEEAQRILDGATLTSPIDGTVLSVSSSVGEILDKDTYKSPFIEIADLSQPVLKASFDESDLASLNSDCSVTATFTGLKNKTYKGTITQIDPTLSTKNGVSSVTTYIQIENDPSEEITNLPVGLNATLELVCPIAKNVTNVPLQALKNEEDGKAQVYVVNSDGTYTAHTVEVGVKTMSAAEIKGDIKAGDKVVTSTIKQVETK
ncbi:MAG: efflux RND transporter periplasmic adaptor subunit [Leptolinea sp.]|jgi:RND family efflux transporter MFP subunit|nr:efflux RND transporter periplasmic adaptor subunit [Leptolinea sp.]